MSTAALLTTAPRHEQPEYPLTDDLIEKMWCTHTTEYYSAVKRKEILPFAAMYLDLNGGYYA